jgi:hypothetical protein
MSVACQIIRDSSGNISGVTQPSGKESVLFNQLAQKFGGNGTKALQYWGIIHTPDFKDYYRDSDVEPDISVVLRYAEDINTPEATAEDVIAAVGLLERVGMNSTDFIRMTEKKLVTDGALDISEQSLKDAAMFSDSESSAITANPTRLKAFINILNKLRYRLQDLVFGTTDSQYEDRPIDMANADRSGVGEYSGLEPIHSELAETLAGVKDPMLFEDKVNELRHTWVKDKFATDETFRRNFFNTYSNLSRTPVFEEVDGQIVFKQFSKEFEEYLETLPVGKDNVEFSTKIALLANADAEVWAETIDSIKEVLKQIEVLGADLGIDLTGITDIAESRDKVLEVIVPAKILTDRLRMGSVPANQVRALLEPVLAFQGAFPEGTQWTFNNVTGYNTDNVVQFSSIKSEEELFQEYGFVKLENGLYTRMNQATSLEDAIETIIDVAIESDRNTIPKVLFPKSVMKNGELVPSKLESKREVVAAHMSRVLAEAIPEFMDAAAIQNHKTAAEITLHKVLLNAQPRNESTPTMEEIRIISEIDNDNYLVSDFKADFRQFILSEKVKDSVLYNRVLKHFRVSREGIKIEDYDSKVMESLRVLAEMNPMIKNLKNYSYISRNSEINSIFVKNPLPIRNDLKLDFTKREYRNLYVNYPKALPLFNGSVTTTNNHLFTRETNVPFLRTNQGAYELMKEEDGVSYYKMLPDATSSPYMMLNLAPAPLMQETTLAKDTKGTTPKISHLMSKSEASKLQNEIDCA